MVFWGGDCPDMGWAGVNFVLGGWGSAVFGMGCESGADGTRVVWLFLSPLWIEDSLVSQAQAGSRCQEDGSMSSTADPTWSEGSPTA